MDHSIAVGQTGEDFHAVGKGFSRFHKAKAGFALVVHENNLHLAALHDGAGRDTDRLRLADRNGRAAELTRTKFGRCGEIELHKKGAACGIGGGRNLGDDAFEGFPDCGNGDFKSVSGIHHADQRLGHIGFDAKFTAILDFQKRPAGGCEIADLRQTP